VTADSASEAMPPSGGDPARLDATRLVVERVRRDGPGSQSWDLLAHELAAYGLSVMRAWIRSGAIFTHVREAGWPVTRPPASFTVEEIYDIAVDTVVSALRLIHKAVFEGGWSPDHGASLTTYFSGACVRSFPNVYRRFMVVKRGRDAESPVGLSVDDVLQSPLSTPFPDVEGAMDLVDVLEGLPQESRDIFVLRARGHSYGEIGAAVGLTESGVAARIMRARTRATRRKLVKDE
jgi:DNA-directed RNA polymerase specialized sigma24 family protein